MIPSLQPVRYAAVVGIALALTTAGVLAQPAEPYDPRYDVTGNGAIDGSDAAVAASSWSDRAAEAPCALDGAANADMDGDGCLDVSDVQRIAARIGGTLPAVPAGAVPGASNFTWTVNSAGEGPDSAPGNGVCRADNGRCTFRAALEEANRSVGPDTIVFDVRNGDGSCPALVTITPDSKTYGALTLDDPRNDGTVVDGYTQCGARPNSNATDGNAAITIELRGGADRNIHGLRILSRSNVVRGLALYNWDRQIEIFGDRARYNRVEGNFIGTNAGQTFTSSDMGTHHSEGIRIQIGAANTIIGCGAWNGDQFQPCSDEGRAWAARNIVAGNGNDGIHLEREATNNHIAGNYVGIKQDGESRLRNSADGVDFEQGPQNNWLGGLTPLERNIISGNGSEGIEISHGTDTQFNHVAGNYFGLDATGTRAIPNKGGISFEDTVDQNYAYNNVVSGNLQNGFRFYVLATRNEVRGNIVGLAADGRTPMPNRHHGVYVMGGSQHNLISENIIASNSNHGILLASTSDADNNYIGKTYYNTITRNQIFNNRKSGIEFYTARNLPPNEGLSAPTLTRANSVRVEGTACPGCVIELFQADKTTTSVDGGDNNGEGMRFLGRGQADGAGRFTFDIQAVSPGLILTATATDVKGNTSGFARNIAVTDVVIGDPTPAPTLTFTPIPPPTQTPTPRPGETPEPGIGQDGVVFLPLTQR